MTLERSLHFQLLLEPVIAHMTKATNKIQQLMEAYKCEVNIYLQLIYIWLHKRENKLQTFKSV